MKISELKNQIKKEIIEILSEESVESSNPEELAAKTTALQAFNTELTKTRDISQDLSEDEDQEASKSDLKKIEDEGETAISNKMQETAAELKKELSKWKKSEGDEKEKHLKRLKELTKIKQELESML